MRTGPTYEREMETALAAVREAARLCRVVQQDLGRGVLQKADTSPVTVADFGSQALVCRALQEAFPDDPVIGEEDAERLRQPENEALRARIIRHVLDTDPEAERERVLDWIDRGAARAYSDRFWTLDPVDGTKGFLRGEQYAVALALIVNGEVTVAAMACPNLPFHDGLREHTGAIFTAVKGGGTLRMPMDIEGGPHVVHVSGLTDVRRATLTESVDKGHSSQSDTARVMERLGITEHPIRMDSQNKYAIVASGLADVYLRFPTRPGYVERIWDHAAGSLIVTEGGGRVTDIHGRPLEFSHGAGLTANKGLVVTNGHLHEEVMEAVHAVGVTVA